MIMQFAVLILTERRSISFKHFDSWWQW